LAALSCPVPNDPKQVGSDAIFRLKDDKLTFANNQSYKRRPRKATKKNQRAQNKKINTKKLWSPHNGSLIPSPHIKAQKQINRKKNTKVLHKQLRTYISRRSTRGTSRSGGAHRNRLLRSRPECPTPRSPRDWSGLCYIRQHLPRPNCPSGLDVFELTPKESNNSLLPQTKNRRG